MIRKLSSQRSLLFEVAVFAALAVLFFRGALPVEEGSPNFSVEARAGVHVMLGAGFPEPGLRQYHDDTTIGSVMELTGLFVTVPELRNDPLVNRSVRDGETLVVVRDAADSARLETGWLPARQRLALGIALHPDRMSLEDWITLPGIGEKLASQIELDRQNYGDFGRFEALERVKGIGPAKLKALQPFFLNEDN